MIFTKMQGCGNDYIYINNDIENVDDMSEVTINLSNRHFGVGGDGCIYIFKNDTKNVMDMCNGDVDIYFRIFNPDGSEASMCGNGIRCVAKYVYENGLVKKKKMKIGTKSGVREVEIKNDGIKVEMGIPMFNTDKLEIDYPKDVIINEKIMVDKKELYITCLSVGNLHTVTYVDNVDEIDIEKYGYLIEHLDIFKDRTNVEFVQVIDENNIKVRVWERGVGETLACGTGATAAAMSSYLNGATKNKCKVFLRGGTLDIEYEKDNEKLYMTGPATFIYEGKMY